MRYSQLRYGELENIIEEELKYFCLPPDWRENREAVDGLAVDDTASREIDDAVGIEQLSDGGFVLSASIADVGSFLSMPSALRTRAQRLGCSKYDDRRTMISMWPAELSKKIFSLGGDAERPVITTRLQVDAEGNVCGTEVLKGIARVERTTRKQFREELCSDGQKVEESETAIYGLFRVARLLHDARIRKGVGQPNKGISNAFPKGMDPAGFVVGEIMMATNLASAQFMADNRIPGIFRVQDKSVYDEYLPVKYVTTPKHSDIMGAAYTQVTSPLREFASFVCQSNIAAYLDGQPFPFAGRNLEGIAARLNKHDGAKRSLSYQGVQAITQGFETGMANLSDCLKALFVDNSVLGSEALRSHAINFLLANPKESRGVFNAAIARGILTCKPNPDKSAKASHIVQDDSGKEYPFHLSVDPNKFRSNKKQAVSASRQLSDISTLADIFGVARSELEFSRLVPEAFATSLRAIPDNIKAREKHFPRGLQFNYSYGDDGSVTAHAFVLDEGEIVECSAVAVDQGLATSFAAHKLMVEMNYFQDGPQLGASRLEDILIKKIRGLQNTNGYGPKLYLFDHLREILGNPDYKPECIAEEPDSKGLRKFSIVFLDQYGARHELCAVSDSRRHGLDLAALRALKRLRAPIIQEIDPRLKNDQ